MRSIAGKTAAWMMVGLGALAAAVAQAQPSRGIYTCVAASGQRLTSDRLIPECTDREQRLLNSDGSLRRIIPPTLTADERTAKEARDRQLANQRAAQQDAIRRDRNLMQRYPTQDIHDKARAASLDDILSAMKLTERRLQTLAEERKPLQAEAEFYAGKPLPFKLKQKFNANDAATEAQRSLVQTQQAELVRINGLYDAELARLRRLWRGEPPGSLGTPPAAALASDRAAPTAR